LTKEYNVLMSAFVLTIIFSFLEATVSLVGGLALLWKDKLIKKASVYIISFATGALLSVALLDLLPEAIEESGYLDRALGLALTGFLAFFIIERILLWRHGHETEEEETHSYTSLVAIGDTVHNFIDGVVIGATFLVDTRLGMLTTLAVVFHELPQEVGDFSIMLHAGLSKGRVFVYNLISSSATIVGAIATFLLGSRIENAVPVLISLVAGGLLYIAASDLIPQIAKEEKFSKIFFQIVLLLLGVGTLLIVGQITKI
jgi:zinc and cadmium transporter